MRLAMVLALVCACEVPRTQLMIGVATDIRAPDQVDQVTLSITRADNGSELLDTFWEVTGTPTRQENLPGSHAVYSDGEETPLELVLTAMNDGSIVVTQRARLALVRERTTFFRMGLTTGCSATDCATDQTCVEGVCTDLDVNALQLPDFTEELVTTLSCNSGTVYRDTATGEPMETAEGAATCPPDLCREGTCLLPPPGGGTDIPRDGGVVIPPDAGEDISCGDPIGKNCFGNPDPPFCICEASCSGGRLNSLRCEGGTCTCRFDTEVTLTFDQPATTCFESYSMCQIPN